MPGSSLFRIYDSIPFPVVTAGTLSQTDASDTASMSATATFPTITGTLSASAGADTASMAMTVTTPSSGGGTTTATTWSSTDKSSAITLSSDKKSAVFTGYDYYDHLVRATKGVAANSTTAFSFKITFNTTPPSRTNFGLILGSVAVDSQNDSTGASGAYFSEVLHRIVANGSSYASDVALPATVAGDTFVFHLQNGYLTVFKNGNQIVTQDWFGKTSAFPTTNLGSSLIYPYIHSIGDSGVNPDITADFTYWDATPGVVGTWTGSRFSWDNTVSWPGDGTLFVASNGGNTSNGHTEGPEARGLAGDSAKVSGLRYWEVKIGKRAGNVVVGLEDTVLTNPDRPYYFNNGFQWRSVDGNVLTSSTITGEIGWTYASSLPYATTGQTLRFCTNDTLGKFWVTTGTNSWNGDATANPATGVGGLPLPTGMSNLVPHVRWEGDGANDDSLSLRTAACLWEYTAPTGFVAVGQPDYVAPTATTWTPANLDSAKKVGWFDAQDAATITQSSGAVSAWSNKFGSSAMSNLTQATGTLQPAYSATGFNGSYSGVTSIAKAMNATITGLTDELTVIVIGKFEGAGGGRFISVGLQGNADWDYGGALLEIINDGGYKFHPYGQYTDFGYVGAQGTSPQSWAAQFKNGASKFRVNGLQPGATNTSAFGFGDPARFAIGDDVQGDRTDCNITYAEIVVLKNATADDIARVEAYAMWKRGLQGTLDASQPYKSAAPTVSGGGTVTTTTGTLTATDASDTASITASVSFPAITGTLTGSEASDTASMAASTRNTGTLTGNEASDTASISGSILTTGTLTATEASDTSALAAATKTTVTLTATEASDAAAISASTLTTGTLVGNEASDTAAFSGSINTLATINATEGNDTAFISDNGSITGFITATEAADVAAITGSTKTTGTLTATEASDTAAIAATIRTTGTLTGNEATDTSSITASVSTGIVATVVATEANDKASITGSTKTTGTLTATEAADGSTITAVTFVSGTLSASEAADTASVTGSVFHKVTIIATEGGDTASMTWTTRQTGILVATEPMDLCVFRAKIYRPFQEVSEAHDAWTEQSQAHDAWTPTSGPSDTWTPR